MLLLVWLLLTLVLPSVGPCPLVRVSSFVLFACFVPCVRTCLRAVLLLLLLLLKLRGDVATLSGKSGLPKDAAQARKWYLKVAGCAHKHLGQEEIEETVERLRELESS